MLTGGDAADQAAGWYARLHAPVVDVRSQAGFTEWLAAAPAHQLEWAKIEAANAVLDGLAQSRALEDLLDSARQPAMPVRQHYRWIAVAAVIPLIAGTGFLAFQTIEGRNVKGDTVARAPSVYESRVGEQRAITLTDGSSLTLDTASKVEVALSDARRDVTLVAGQAMFKVAKDKQRPFMVHAGGNTVTALGTRFDVRIDPNRFYVALEEGKVSVATPAFKRSTTLTPGKTLVATGATITVSRSAGEVSGWTDGYIRFDSTPLPDAVAEMNRYTRRKIVVAGAGMARQRVSGVFRTDGGLAFAHGLEAYRIARVDESDAAQIVLRPY